MFNSLQNKFTCKAVVFKKKQTNFFFRVSSKSNQNRKGDLNFSLQSQFLRIKNHIVAQVSTVPHNSIAVFIFVLFELLKFKSNTPFFKKRDRPPSQDRM